MPHDDVVFFAGKRVDEMTREELVEALTIMGRLYNQELDAHHRSLRVMSAFRRARHAA